MVTLGGVPAATAAATFSPKVKKSLADSATVSWGSLDLRAASAWSSQVRDGPLFQICQNSTVLPEAVGAAAALEAAEAVWLAVVAAADVVEAAAAEVDADVARLVVAAADVGVAAVELVDAAPLDAVTATAEEARVAEDAVPALAVLAIPPVVVVPPQLLSANAAPTPATVRSNDRRLMTARPIPPALVPFRPSGGRTAAPVVSISQVSFHDSRVRSLSRRREPRALWAAGLEDRTRPRNAGQVRMGPGSSLFRVEPPTLEAIRG